MFNFINIYSFIPASGCVGMSTSAQLCPGAMMLLRRPCIEAEVIYTTHVK
jgi:hypothetical protein